jgi:hypothetical protein
LVIPKTRKKSKRQKIITFLEELKQQRLSILFNYLSTSTSSANIKNRNFKKKKKSKIFKQLMNYDDSDDDFQYQDDQL